MPPAPVAVPALRAVVTAIVVLAASLAVPLPAAADGMRLATEAGGGGQGGEAPAGEQPAGEQPAEPAGAGDEQLPGPEPDLETTFAPDRYEAPWTWWMGVILTGVAVLAIAGVGIGWLILVDRRRQRDTARR